MASNLAFDDGHPYLEVGADDGFLFQRGARVGVSDTPAPPAIEVTLERSIDGVVWEPVAETDDIAALIDWESWSYGDIRYRATALTAEGAASVSILVVEARSGALWLSGGVGYGMTARLPFNPTAAISAGRARALKQYAGRQLPVGIVGEALSRAVAVAGMTADAAIAEHYTADVERLTMIAQLPEAVFMFRDPDGRRIYGAIDSMEMGRIRPVGTNGLWSYDFTLTETELR